MKKIASFMGIKLYIIPQDYFRYHIVIKSKKVNRSNASMDFKNAEKFIKETLIMILSKNIISDHLSKKWYNKLIGYKLSRY